MHLGRRLCRKTARGKTPYRLHPLTPVWTSSSSSTIAPSSLEHDGSYPASESSRETSPRPSRKRSATEASLADDDLEDDGEAEPPDQSLEDIFDWVEKDEPTATPDILSEDAPEDEGSCEPSSPPDILTEDGTEPRARFLRAVQDESEDMRRLLDAMYNDEWIHSGLRRPGEHLTWEEFCSQHDFDGDRFKKLLEPLMDEPTPLVDPIIRLREFGGDDYLMKMDMLVGERDEHREQDLKLWVFCAMFLARNPTFEAPACMSSEPEQV